MYNKEQKQKIIDYIKINHSQTYIWLQNHIVKKFGVEINGNTIRTWKRQYNCLTNRPKCKVEWIKYIRANWCKHSDKKLAQILICKFNRSISYHTVRHIRHKYLCYRPKRPHYRTVKEVRKCLYCGNEIKITCRNPKQKFCCKKCYYMYRSRNTNKRNLEIATPDKVKQFFKDWYPFINRICYDKKGSLHINDIEEVLSDCISQIPSMIYWLDKHKYTSRQHIKGYIAKTVINCIKRKQRKVIPIQKNESSLEIVGKNYRTI